MLFCFKFLLRYLRALPTIRVHPEFDGRTLGIFHSLTINYCIFDEIYLVKCPSEIVGNSFSETLSFKISWFCSAFMFVNLQTLTLRPRVNIYI